MKITYYKIKTEHFNYKGDRYFKFDPSSEHVLQVCFNQGCKKGGRSNAIGVYEISRVTFLNNYYNDYAEKSTKREFEKKFFKTINNLIQ